MSQPLVGMDLSELREAVGPGQPAYRARQLYEALYRRREFELARVSTLPSALREVLGGSYAVGLPEIATVYESSDGTRRYLLRRADGRAMYARAYWRTCSRAVTFPEKLL